MHLNPTIDDQLIILYATKETIFYYLFSKDYNPYIDRFLRKFFSLLQEKAFRYQKCT